MSIAAKLRNTGLVLAMSGLCLGGAALAGGSAADMPAPADDALSASGAIAQDVPMVLPDPVVLELYTSQGCVACPPADEIFSVIAEQPGVLALALHVDYWDYLGWKDAFSRPEFTDRQRRYAKAANSRMVYTPEVIVAGTDRIQGTEAAAIAEAIAIHSTMSPKIELDALRDDQGWVEIGARALVPLEGPVRVHLVHYLPEQHVRIERGENEGREMVYRNIVTSWTTIGEWTGKEALAMRIHSDPRQKVAVIMQKPGPGAVMAAARVD